MKKSYYFWIQRDYSGAMEKISIQAVNSQDAINSLPKCVAWDFSTK